jgi:hypothetical protein
MLAVPALTRLWYADHDRLESAGRATTAMLGAVAAVAVTATLLVAAAWRGPWQRLQWTPMSPEAAEAIASCEGPLYNLYGGGGPIIWFVPTQKVFLDSRQDQFPDALVNEATAVENGGDPRTLFARHNFRCAALPPSSPTVARLDVEGWRRLYEDSDWVVLAR